MSAIVGTPRSREVFDGRGVGVQCSEPCGEARSRRPGVGVVLVPRHFCQRSRLSKKFRDAGLLRTYESTTLQDTSFDSYRPVGTGALGDLIGSSVRRRRIGIQSASARDPRVTLPLRWSLPQEARATIPLNLAGGRGPGRRRREERVTKRALINGITWQEGPNFAEFRLAKGYEVDGEPPRSTRRGSITAVTNRTSRAVEGNS